MRLTVLGCGDAFGSGGRFNTSFHLALADGHRVALDFGATSMVALNREGLDPDGLDAVVLSHLHGDHAGGVPFLLLYLHYMAGRTRPLTIAGPPGTEAWLQRAVEALFGKTGEAWSFPLEVVPLQPGQDATVAGLGVAVFPVVHGDITSHALRLSDGRRLLAYSGDTTWTDVLPEVGRDADLFIMECYAPAGPCATHTDWEILRAHLPEITAKRVMLTHMNAAMLAQRDRVSVGTLADGMIIDI